MTTRKVPTTTDDRQGDLLSLLLPDLPLPPSAHAGVQQAQQNADAWWKSCAMSGIRHFAATGADFTSADVRSLDGIPEPDHANRWGAAFRTAQAEGLIVPVGAKPSNTGSRRGGLVRVWRGVAA